MSEIIVRGGRLLGTGLSVKVTDVGNYRLVTSWGGPDVRTPASLGVEFDPETAADIARAVLHDVEARRSDSGPFDPAAPLGATLGATLEQTDEPASVLTDEQRARIEALWEAREMLGKRHADRYEIVELATYIVGSSSDRTVEIPAL